MCVCVRVCSCVSNGFFASTAVSERVSERAGARACVCVCVNARAHTYTHTHTHTHTGVCVCLMSLIKEIIFHKRMKPFFLSEEAYL